MPEMTVPLVSRGNGRWGSSSPAWDHLINRESSGIPDIIQQIHDVNSGGNEAEGLFQITPRTWRGANGTQFAPSARLASPQQQAIVAARIFTRNPTGSDWGAGRPGREDPKQLAAGLVPLNSTTQETPVGWTGDPVWLEDVLRPALGDRLKTLSGWQDSGHGDFADIRGVMVHHTGNSRESAQSIRNGRPDLAGPLSNLHIGPDGTVTIVAVGVCWHAGRGSYPWLPTDNANQHMIGIECAWPDIAANGSYNPAQKWPDKQIIAMRDTCAALVQKLGFDASRVIGHKEYAGAAQGKWDPGNIDMNWFRGEVQKDLNGVVFPGEGAPEQPGPVLQPNYEKEVWDQLRIAWPQLGNRTLVDAVAELLRRTEPKAS